MFSSFPLLRSASVCVASCVTGLLVAFASMEEVAAQRQSKVATAVPPTQPTLAAIAQAASSQDATLEQFRRFRDESGNVTTVRERLEIQANGTAEPEFRLTMLSVVGFAAGSPIERKWRANYQRFGETLFRHGSFHIRDLAKASSNYSVHSFGAVTIANRSAECVVVYPASGGVATGRAIWVLYIDSQTKVPLYVAEFDAQLRVFAEIEAITFTPSVQPLAAATSPSAFVTQTLPTFHAAKNQFGAVGARLVDPYVSQATGFGLDDIKVRTDPLNGSRKLRMSYTDGIDEFVIEQAPATQDPFAGLPGGAGNAHTIARFRDPALQAMVFFDDKVTFHVSGRGSLTGLDKVAQDVFRQALAN